MVKSKSNSRLNSRLVRASLETETDSIQTAPTAAYMVALLFAARTASHMAHLKTTCFSDHVALQDYYEGVVDLADSFAECYQGRYGLLVDYPSIPQLQDHKPLIMIQAIRAWVDENRNDCGAASELQGIIDDIQALNNSTIYKLGFLD